MNCVEREDFQKSELFHIIYDIEHMEKEGRRYKAMFVLWDVIQRMKRNELTASMNQAEVFADYGIIIEDGKITTPVKSFTVAGNFFDLLKQIDSVDNELELGAPGYTQIASPNVFVPQMSVAGE